jgi:DNA-binding Lrp family transcriptional regulator
MLVELSVVEQRYHAVVEVVCGGIPVVEVAERYGVSRKKVHTRLGRYRQDGLQSRSLAPAHPRKYSRNFGKGPSGALIYGDLEFVTARARPVVRIGGIPDPLWYLSAFGAQF